MSHQNNQKPLNGEKNAESGIKTIIGFDSWTQGASHFLRLCPELKRRGYRLLLIHLGSWGHDTGRQKEELIGEMLVRDISYYEGKPFSTILDDENPSCIVFLSTRAIAHRAFNRWAQFKNIPTCHLYHGLVRSVAQSEVYSYTNYFQHLQVIYKRVSVNVFKIIPIYLKALLLTSADRTVLASFLISLLEKLLSKKLTNNKYIKDTSTSIGFVYLESEKMHMAENYSISEENIYVVGNPDLMTFGLQPSDMGCRCSSAEGDKTVVYIDTALSKSGAVFSSDDDFIEHLISTDQSIKTFGYRLLVKLHPSHLRSKVPSALERKGIELIGNMEFVSRLKQTTAAIVEPSSAAIIPALLGLPILLAQFDKLAGQLYGEMISTYPRARGITNIHEIDSILTNEQKHIEVEKVISWIFANSGPLPAEHMPKRVVSAIDQLLSRNGQRT